MRIIKMGVFLVILLLLLGSTALADWTGASGEQFISSLASGNQVACPAFAVGPNYELYAVWGQGLSPSIPIEVYFSKSTDNGQTWTGTSADRRISPNDGNGISYSSLSGARRIDIAVNSLGYIFVVWPENYIPASFDTTLEVMMVMSTDGGTTWIHSDTDFPVSDTLTDYGASTPNIAIDLNDNIHVIWNQTDPSTNRGEIYYSYSSDNGITWTGRAADRRISYANNYSSSYSDIDIGPDNKIHLVWTEYISSSDKRVLYGVSTDGGTTFSCESSDSVISYAPYTGEIRYPRVKAKPFAGHVHVVYAQNDTAVYVGTTDGGANWNETVIWEGASYDMYGPDIAVTTTGTMVAIMDEQYPGTDKRQIYASYSFDYGLTWSVTLDPVSHYDSPAAYDGAYIPSVLITNTDVLHCLYANNYPPTSGSYQEMCYSQNDSLGILLGALRGTVTELDGSTPIEGVQVTVYDSNSVAADYDNTDIDGTYYFGLEPGTYSANFSKYTHHDTSVTNILIESNVLDTVDISMSPTAQGMISGNVYEQTGTTPLEFVKVEVLGEYMIVWATDTTDGSGHYEFTLYPGAYDIRFSVELFNDTTVIDQTLTEGGSIVLDVNMTWAIPADEIGPVSIDMPINFMIIDNSYTPVVTVENYGYQNQTFDLNLKIMDESITEIYNHTEYGLSVDSLNEFQVVFGEDFTPISAEDYIVTTSVINDGDENTENDTLSTIITAFAHQGFGGPDNYGYYYRDNTVPCGPEFSWIDISSTGTQIEPDELFFMSDSLPIGFSLEFYGHLYNKMFVNSDGAINLGIRTIAESLIDCPIPDPTSPHAPMVMAFWDDKTVHYNDGQGVYYQYFDEPDVDYTVVQWDVSDMNHYDSLQFEVIMYENNRIVFQYNLVSPEVAGGLGDSAAIGLELDVQPELFGISYICVDDNPANHLFNGLAIEWFNDMEIPGLIAGIVTDASTQSPIEGVYVEAVGLDVGDLTDINGEYTLPELYPCDYSISFSHADYAETTVTDVTVNPNSTTTLNMEMNPPQFGYEYLPGDVNMSGGTWPPAATGPDVTYLVNFFRGMPTSQSCLLDGFWCSADANGDCNIIGSDVTKLVNVFRSIGSIGYCADYEPIWPTPADLPAEAPVDWPNCD